MSAIPTPEDVGQTLREFVARMDAFKRKLDHQDDRIKTLVHEKERLRENNERLEQRVDELEAKAEQAMVVASAGHSPDMRSKKEVAYHIARNELVRRAAMDYPESKIPLTINGVQKRAEPENVLKWQTVRDAFDELKHDWAQFRETTTGGEQALTVTPRDITKPLVRAVEVDLDRDDLTKGLVGGEPVKGNL